ncbi:hypothetical protein IDM30_10040 [Acinetobacter seifertii]|nr:hypothetical protein [Acinetobacter seifertii]
MGLNFWEEQCPAVEGIGLALVNPENGGKALNGVLGLSVTLNRSINASKCHIGWKSLNAVAVNW